MSELIPGFTSTGSKRPEALFGAAGSDPSLPRRMARAAGCRVWDEHGREYLDFIMALGAVGLGYGHPAVSRAAAAAVEAGVVGPLPPVLEEEVASAIRRHMPWVEAVRFLKTGAEAMAAAVRLARAATGRDLVIGCGYHGWLDWCQRARGVPASTQSLFAETAFNDADRARESIRRRGDLLAAVVLEPIVVVEPTREWLAAIREETARVGALLIVDEVKTVCRLAVGGGTERYGIHPDLVVLGKAIANGFPLAAVGGRRDVMEWATRTWISSTLATEMVALAAARATLEVMVAERVPSHLARVGRRLVQGLESIRERHPDLVAGVAGVPEMCFVQYAGDEIAQAVAVECARRGLLFKRTAYNFVSLAHGDAEVDRGLELLDDALESVERRR